METSARRAASVRRIDPAGLACAMAGACLWGMSFVIPAMLPGISPWDISLGRYLVYGLLGGTVLLRQYATGLRLPSTDWGYALLFAVTGYYGCYTALVYAIEAVGPALPTLVMGLTPMTVAMAGNLRTREVPFRRLLPPLAAIGLGLAAVNLSRHGQALSTNNLGAGLAYSLLALGLLTWYLIANMLFLKKRPGMSPLVWSNALGTVLLGLSALALCARLLTGQGLPWEGPGEAAGTTAGGYLAGCLTLGVGASWLGGVLWNRANATLPAALMGQCIVFWPLSGILFAYMLRGALPQPAEAAGMALVFAGILWGLKSAKNADTAK